MLCSSALAQPLLRSLHLFLRESAHISRGCGVATLGKPLLSAVAELLVLLLPLVLGAPGGPLLALLALVAALSLALAGYFVLERDIEEVFLFVVAAVGVLTLWNTKLVPIAIQTSVFWSRVHTALEDIDLVQCILLLLVPLLLLSNLDLLAELLEITLLARIRRGLLACSLIHHLGLDLAHMLIGLDHLRKVVIRPGECHTLFRKLGTPLYCGIQALLVESQLASQVVVDISNLDGRGRGDGLVRRER